MNLLPKAPLLFSAPRFESLAQGFQRRAPLRRDGVGGEKESVGRSREGGEEYEEGNDKSHGEIMIEAGSFVKGKYSVFFDRIYRMDRIVRGWNISRKVR